MTRVSRILIRHREACPERSEGTDVAIFFRIASHPAGIRNELSACQAARLGWPDGRLFI